MRLYVVAREGLLCVEQCDFSPAKLTYLQLTSTSDVEAKKSEQMSVDNTSPTIDGHLLIGFSMSTLPISTSPSDRLRMHAA